MRRSFSSFVLRAAREAARAEKARVREQNRKARETILRYYVESRATAEQMNQALEKTISDFGRHIAGCC